MFTIQFLLFCFVTEPSQRKDMKLVIKGEYCLAINLSTVVRGIIQYPVSEYDHKKPKPLHSELEGYF